MPTISSCYGILIMMFWKDYNPPHFHVKYGEYEALIGINDFSVIQGWLLPKAMALLAEWASIHHNELVENWDRGIKDLSFNKIEPLK